MTAGGLHFAEVTALLLRHLVAFPESQRVLKLQLPAVLCFSVLYGVLAMTPFFVRKTLGAGVWQTFLATSSVAFMCSLAIFWNEIYRRLGPGRYLTMLWVVAILPLAAIAVFTSAWPILTCLLLAASANGAIQPFTADIMRACYPPDRRSRVFSVLKVVEQLVVMSVAWGIAAWLDRDEFAYRFIFPLSAILVGLGLVLMYRISRETMFCERPQPQFTTSFGRSLLLAWHGMARALRQDPEFRQFEAGYTTYGLGWMMCFALLPFIVVDRLSLRYEEIVWSTTWSQNFTILLMLVPFGLLMERMGPIRFTAVSFLPLLVYPLGLLYVWNWPSLAGLMVLYGLSMTGMNLVWTMAPLTLARDAAQASHYLAIHATLVSVRGLLGQLPAVAWYAHMHGFRPILVLATGLFALAFVIMMRLDRRLRATSTRAEGAATVKIGTGSA